MNLKKIIKPILIGLAIVMGTAITIIIGFVVIVGSSFGLFDKKYNTTELVENFNNNKQQIYIARQYFNSIIPKYKKINIEFDGKKISRLEIYPIDTGRGSDLTTNFLDWNLSQKKN